MAGRTALRLLPLTISEIQASGHQRSLFSLMHGFYPGLIQHKLEPSQALCEYFSTYVERDLRQLSAIHDLQKFERFVRLCAEHTGQLLNMNNLGSDAGISHSTARQWLDPLYGALFENMIIMDTTHRLAGCCMGSNVSESIRLT